MRAKSISIAVFLVLMILLENVYGGDEGNHNTFYGTGAGASLSYTAMTYATFIGAGAGNLNTSTGYQNTFIGYRAGYLNTSTDANTFVGYLAGYNNQQGSFNTFMGAQVGYSNQSGNYNTFVGALAGSNNTEGLANTFVGEATGFSNIGGSDNTFLGKDAGNSNIGGSDNTFLGTASGRSNTEGSYNTFLGKSAGYHNTNGLSNTFVGYQAGFNNIDGGGNVFLGYNAGFSETGNDKLYIDSSATSTPLIYGEFDNQILTINGKLGIGTTTPTQKIDLGGGAITLNGSDNTGAMPPGLSSQSYDPGRIDFGYGGSGGGNLEAYSKAPTNYSSPADDRRGEFRFVYGGGSTMGKVRYVHYDGTTWSTRMWLTYDGQLQMTPDGYNVSAYTDGYQWVDGSSREYKENIRGLGVEEAMGALNELSPVKFNYKAGSRETHVGFIAEEVPDLVATNDRKGMSPMDVVAVLTKVVQEQQKTIAELSEKLNKLERNLK